MELVALALAIMLVVETACFAGFVAYTFIERKALLNRIMATDWQSYHTAQQQPAQGDVTAVDDTRERALAESWLAEERARREVMAAEAAAGITLEYT